MAKKYNRRIELFINGQQVNTEVRSILVEMTKLVKEQASVTPGSQRYIHLRTSHMGF